MRISGPDIYFEHDPAPDTLRRASAVAFGVPENAVVATRMLSDTAFHALHDDAVLVLWQRETDDQPGDFPSHFLLQIPGDTEDIDGALSRLAEMMHVPFVVVAGDDDAGDIVLYDTDGSRTPYTVNLREDDDYAIRLPGHALAGRRGGRPVAI